MIIALVGGKGGGGKTTLAIALAVEFHSRGKKVLLVDADPQGSSLTWGEVAAEEGREGPEVVAIGSNIVRTLPKLAAAFDVTIVDSPGRISKRQAAALMVADLALLPCAPTTLEIWALAESVEMVRDAQELRSNLEARIVIVRKRPGTTSARTIVEALEELGMEITETALGLRETYSEALAAGMGPTTYAPSSLAAGEIKRLALEVDSVARAGLARAG